MKYKITMVSDMPILQLGKCVPSWEHEYERSYPTDPAPAARRCQPLPPSFFIFYFFFLRIGLIYVVQIVLNFLCRQGCLYISNLPFFTS